MRVEFVSPSLNLLAHQSYPFAFLPDFMRLTAQSRGAHAFLALDRQTGASMPLILRERAGFRVLTCLYVPCGSDGLRLDQNSECAFLNRFVQASRDDLRAHRISAPENWCLFAKVPHVAVSCPFASYVVDLTQDESDLWKGLHQKHRNAIRMAIKSDVSIEMGLSVLEACHEIYASTMRLNGLQSHSLAFFKALGERIPNAILPLISVKNGKIQSSALVLHTIDAAYYVYGGTSVGGADAGANCLLHYNAMLALKATGVRCYDFVGARIGVELTERQAGIQRFKSRFGGKLHTGALWKIDLAPRICRWSDLGKRILARAKGRSPMLDLIDQINAAPNC
jgi:hypothetical protein